MRRLGSGLGCGAITVLTEDCPVAVAASVMAYFDRENASQCGSCFNGTAAMSAVTEALRDGVCHRRGPGPAGALVGRSLRGRGACATLDAATNVAASLLSAVPASGRSPPRKRLRYVSDSARSKPCGPTKWRRC